MAQWSYSFNCTLHYPIIISMQTYLNVPNFQNAPQLHSVEFVSKIKSILSVIFHSIYGVVCIRLTNFSYDDCENMRTLSYWQIKMFNQYYHHQIGSKTHLLLFRVRSCNNGMRCFSFYILICWLVFYVHIHVTKRKPHVQRVTTILAWFKWYAWKMFTAAQGPRHR